MEQDGTWRAFIGSFLSDPVDFIQLHWPWLLFLLILLFALSKLNNYLEVKGVDKAILITRGLVGSVMAFIVTPFALLLFVNCIAWVKGLPGVNMWNIVEWLQLTITSFWWILECMLDIGESPTSTSLYHPSSIVRIAWIALPVLFIWLRIMKTRFWRLMYLPILLGLLVITANRWAPPTFLDDHIPMAVTEWQPSKHVIAEQSQIQHAPPAATVNRTEGLLNRHRKLIIVALLCLLAVGCSLGYYSDYKLVALGLILFSCFGFVQLFKSTIDTTSILPASKETEIIPTPKASQLTKEFKAFEALFKAHDGKNSVALSQQSFKINALLKSTGERPPARFCNLYRDYFFDYCE